MQKEGPEEMTQLTGNSILQKNLVLIVIFAAFAVWVGILCFYHLDEAGTQNWDEARHIVNAYEMMSSDNPWINTYRGEVDYYNFKPPLSMWCIIFFFKLFGTSFYSMRLYSGVAMFLTFLIVFIFLFRNFGRRAAVIFGLLLITGEDLFFFHMARSADADALYILLYTAAILCLYMSEKRPWQFCLCCFFFSLAFLAKCLHVASGIAVMVCYLPRIYKKLQIKHYAMGGLCLVLPTGIWALVRFRYDGFTFFAGMMGQEVVNRVRRAQDYLSYTRYFFETPMLVLSLCITVLSALIMVWISKKSAGRSNHSILDLAKKIVSHKLYLFFLWFLIPFGIYSVSGAFNSWYFYICYIPFYIICGTVLGQFTAFHKRCRPIAVLLILILLVGVGFQTKKNITNLNTLIYECNTDIRHDLAELTETYPSAGNSRIYIENNRNEYLAQNVWEQNCIADAYMLGNFQLEDGGVPAFIEDEDGLLVISKNLFDEYSSLLTGRVILVDGNDYLIFCNEFY